MPLPLPYTKQQLIQRIRKHVTNSRFLTDDYAPSDNEILLYIDSAIPIIMKGQMFENAKVTGVLDVPEAYLVTYNFTISNQDPNTNEWFVTLPQPPHALPTGYDIPNVYIANESTGRTLNAYPVNVKRNAYRDNMPRPSGVLYRVNGVTLFLNSGDGSPLLNQKLFVQLPIARTTDITEAMNVPGDAIQMIFDEVVKRLLQRYGVPQDVVQDDLTAGNKSS
jgi:hypothetical protein